MKRRRPNSTDFRLDLALSRIRKVEIGMQMLFEKISHFAEASNETRTRKRVKRPKADPPVLSIVKGVKQVRVRQAAPKVTAAPATREAALRIAARLFTVGQACSDLSLPLAVSAGWLPLAGLGFFADRAEEYVRALVELYRKSLAANPGALKRCAGDRRDITMDIAAAEKKLGRLAKIADGSALLDIGRSYIPPEFRLSTDRGFMESLLDDPDFDSGDDADDPGSGSDD